MRDVKQALMVEKKENTKKISAIDKNNTGQQKKKKREIAIIKFQKQKEKHKTFLPTITPTTSSSAVLLSTVPPEPAPGALHEYTSTLYNPFFLKVATAATNTHLLPKRISPGLSFLSPFISSPCQTPVSTLQV